MNKPILIIIAILLIIGGVYFSISNKNSETKDTAEIETNKNYVANSAEECSLIQVTCVEGFQKFNDESGCGCEPVVTSDTKSLSNVINLSGQGLKEIPSSVFDKTKTQELNVSDNYITGSIQSQIGQLSNLRVLNASNNQMTGVPAEIGRLENLEILDLSNNQLTGLPNELGNLKNLKTLNLSGNQYSEQDLDGIRKNLPSTVNIILN